MKLKKLVVWSGHVVEVPFSAAWMAQDQNGHWYTYKKEPRRYAVGWMGTGCCLIDLPWPLTPPEPGRWMNQLYNIEGEWASE